ncbi:hypothetical protein WQQ_31900 [Hydrocarboniphaga effusa AP103]|uniref:Uncharacterized protein n=1 Tax=Hydrocarboniphaga effusa AP103 TaxID=1172194 RepID=I8T798_9GAMM|nr:hypothetical protein WQQ_31900 [Hydrocarboniphaga effusa AP103]
MRGTDACTPQQRQDRNGDELLHTGCLHDTLPQLLEGTGARPRRRRSLPAPPRNGVDRRPDRHGLQWASREKRGLRNDCGSLAVDSTNALARAPTELI